ncbi:hypothetical protein N7373_08475 [Achromobacter mucicolens]|uniref:hypothetical protein n=1 Tax=Achromobacter mucicolens TaxID=1389922 RepID=UPI002446839E|nr:hypothetical protein [Achromobacter mucicolens]MDH0091477.1 hypothetical protein [Achromobacter mucicolens]
MKLSKPSRRAVWLSLLIAMAVVTVVAGWSWNREKYMDEQILMRASIDEPLFDASPWFHSGTYQRFRNDDQTLYPGLEYSQVIMKRSSPTPFTDEEVTSLRVRIYMALTDPLGANFQPVVPASVENIGVSSDFDPRPQTVYVSSGFHRGVGAPGRPVDIYHFYTLLDGKRFFVYIQRDGASGKIIYASRDINFRLPKGEEERRFEELQSKADHQTWLNAPGLKQRSGELCAWPGTWECLELPVGRQTFAHNYQFPQINGQNVTWRFVPSGDT